MGGAYEVTGSAVKKYYAIAGMTIAMRDSADGNALKYLLTDHLGSIVAVADSSGTLISQQRYLPFGQVRTDIGNIAQTDFAFTGQRNNSYIKLYDFRARWLDPELGRFTQPDSIVPNPANPQSLNRYSYGLNNPSRYTDPTGHKPCWATKHNTCNYTPQQIDALRHGTQSEQNFINNLIPRKGSDGIDLSGYSDWEKELIQNLMDAGPEGIHAAEYITEHDVHILFKHLLWGGGGWGLDRNITLQEAYKDKGPGDPFLVGLVAHEAYHLEQGPERALSKIGEIEAWKLGFTVQRNFLDLSHQKLVGTANDIADLDLGTAYYNPQHAIDLIHAYNNEAKDPLYNFFFDLLPTYPLSEHFIYLDNFGR